jgi:hypothetical protein
VHDALIKCLDSARWYSGSDNLTWRGWDPNWISAFVTLHYLINTAENTSQWFRGMISLITFYEEQRPVGPNSTAKLRIAVVDNCNTARVMVFAEDESAELLKALDGARGLLEAK